MTKQRAVFELTFASVLWGFGFVATIWALQEYTSAELLLLRFFLAFTAGMILMFSLRQFPSRVETTQEFKISLVPGLLLGAFMLLQTIGMETTTATKSGFITTIYVLFVPLFNQIFFKQAPLWYHHTLALVALGGTYLLMGANLDHIVKGDYITLVAAAVGALHIISIGLQAKKSKNSFLMNNAQSFWTMLTFIPFVAFQNRIHLAPNMNLAFLGIVFLGLGSSLLAFAIQIRTQKVLSDELASQLFLLEAPFSFLFGYLLLSERLSTLQLIGAGVIIASSWLSIHFGKTKTEAHLH